MRPMTSIGRALRFVWSAAPNEMRILIALNVLYGAGPTLLLYVGKVVIDEVVRLAGTAPQGIFGGFGASQIPLAIAAFVILTFILDSIETLRGLAIDNLRDRTTGEARRRLLTKVAGFQDIAVFEDPQLLNILQLAEQGVERLWRLATGVGRMMVGAFAFMPALLFTFAIGWWVPLLLFLTAIPAVIIQGRVEDRSWEVERAQAENVRKMRLYERVLLTELYAKEVRLFRLQDLFLGYWTKLFQTTFQAMCAVRTHGAWAVVGSSVISAVGAAVPYVFVVDGVLRGRFTPGDLALYAGLIFQVRRSLELLIYEGGEVYQAALGVGPIFALLDLKPRLSLVTAATPDSRCRGICLSNVRFTYPGSERPALDMINLCIRPGETVVLVGENGAGKTTLTKLLVRLYDPDEGVITWDGRDIRSMDVEELRDRIAVVVQDYAHFPVTIRENIAFGDLSKVDQNDTLLAVAREAGLGEVIEKLPYGLDTPLGKMLDGGTDLSEGQWQRLAIARALLRKPKAELVILDEPTAAIDPQSEYEILQALRELTRGRMALIVSHRLSLARGADRVVVLQNGRIVEEGSHEELMALKGVYYSMFTRQASSYV